MGRSEQIVAIVAAFVVVGCVGEVGDARRGDAAIRSDTGVGASDGGVTDDGGSTAGDGGDEPFDAGVPMDAASTDPCERACGHVYDDCGFSFAYSDGTPAPRSACIDACNAGELAGAEECFATAACTREAIEACVPMPDGGMATDGGSGGDWPTGWVAYEDRVLELVNAERARGATCGGTSYSAVGPLAMDEQLRQAARGHSEDMATRGYFDHNTPEGTTPWDRIRAAAYTGGGPLGENIAAGQSTPEEVVRAWMDSPGHCVNIMTGGFREIGVGYFMGGPYGHYWTQNFGGG